MLGLGGFQEEHQLDDEQLGEAASKVLYHASIAGEPTISEAEWLSFMLPRTYLALHEGGGEHAQIDEVFPYMYYIIYTQAIIALCIGTFLSTALLLYSTKHGLGAGDTGLLLGIGEGFGASVIFLSKKIGDKPKKDDEKRSDARTSLASVIASRPLHVPIVLCIVAAATAGFSAPSFPVAVISQMIMSTLNDLSVTLLNELIATSLPPAVFTQYQGMGQWLRRLGNMCTGFTGPVLFSVWYGFPFLMYGCIVGAWAVVIWVRLWFRAKNIGPAKDETESAGPISAFRPFVKKPWHTFEAAALVHDKAKAHARNPMARSLDDVQQQLVRLRVEVGQLNKESRQDRVVISALLKHLRNGAANDGRSFSPLFDEELISVDDIGVLANAVELKKTDDGSTAREVVIDTTAVPVTMNGRCFGDAKACV